jgi:hypothetical protein
VRLRTGVRKGCLVLEPIGILTSGLQQPGGRLSANAFQTNQLRRRFSHQTIQLLVEFADLFGEPLVAARYGAQQREALVAACTSEGFAPGRNLKRPSPPASLCGEAPQSSLFSFSGALMRAAS